MAKDPVCGMDVEPSQAAAKTVYKGTIYYFCSPQCKSAFEQNPDYYLEHGPTGMPGEEHHHEHGHGHGHHHHHEHEHKHESGGCCCC